MQLGAAAFSDRKRDAGTTIPLYFHGPRANRYALGFRGQFFEEDLKLFPSKGAAFGVCVRCVYADASHRDVNTEAAEDVKLHEPPTVRSL